MVNKEEARKYLCDVDPSQCFWVNNGHVLKNMEELSGELQTMSDDTFKHHVNKERNDFTNWINDVIADKKLAKEILSSRSRDSAQKKVKARVSLLKKQV